MRGSEFRSPLENKVQYKVQDLDGCEVVTLAGDSLGFLVDVLPGGNDIFVVRQGEREYLIPALKQIVKDIDLQRRRIEVDLPAGLRQIYES